MDTRTIIAFPSGASGLISSESRMNTTGGTSIPSQNWERLIVPSKLKMVFMATSYWN